MSMSHSLWYDTLKIKSVSLKMILTALIRYFRHWMNFKKCVKQKYCRLHLMQTKPSKDEKKTFIIKIIIKKIKKLKFYRLFKLYIRHIHYSFNKKKIIYDTPESRYPHP